MRHRGTSGAPDCCGVTAAVADSVLLPPATCTPVQAHCPAPLLLLTTSLSCSRWLTACWLR
jgi:hypothetical protein